MLIDRLWVRETWAYWGGDEYLYQQQPEHVIYRADPPRGARDMIRRLGQKWKPSIFMPRWASRLALEITDVRAERVGDIREHDALAEGAHHWLMSKPGRAYDNAASAACRWTKWLDPEARVCSHRGEFAALWDGINGKNPGCSFKESPWVWVLGFRRAEDGEGTGRAD